MFLSPTKKALHTRRRAVGWRRSIWDRSSRGDGLTHRCRRGLHAVGGDKRQRRRPCRRRARRERLQRNDSRRVGWGALGAQRTRLRLSLRGQALARSPKRESFDSRCAYGMHPLVHMRRVHRGGCQVATKAVSFVCEAASHGAQRASAALSPPASRAQAPCGSRS